MSVMEWRGGIPVVLRVDDLTETPVKVDIGTHLRFLDNPEGRYSPGTSKWLHIQVHSTANVKVYFFEKHMDDDEHYITVTQNIPWSAPAEVQELWIAAADADNTAICEITAIARRG